MITRLPWQLTLYLVFLCQIHHIAWLAQSSGEYGNSLAPLAGTLSHISLVNLIYLVCQAFPLNSCFKAVHHSRMDRGWPPMEPTWSVKLAHLPTAACCELVEPQHSIVYPKHEHIRNISAISSTMKPDTSVKQIVGTSPHVQNLLVSV